MTVTGGAEACARPVRVHRPTQQLDATEWAARKPTQVTSRKMTQKTMIAAGRTGWLSMA
jgi:hypothetical protein